MPSEGGEGPIPWGLRDFLGSAYYGLAIIGVIVGLIGWILAQQHRIDALEEKDKEHPTRRELAEIAIRVEDRIASLERHIQDIDLHGTRAMSERMTLIEQGQHSQDNRIQETVRRINDLQVAFNKLNEQIPIIIDRQSNNTNAIRDLQQRVWGRNDKGPIQAYPPH
jgi:hypothetical protein